MKTTLTETRNCSCCFNPKLLDEFNAGKNKCIECSTNRKIENRCSVCNETDALRNFKRGTSVCIDCFDLNKMAHETMQKDLMPYKIEDINLITLPAFTENKEQLTAVGRIEEHQGVKYLILPSRV